jgi:hypothetical protein
MENLGFLTLNSYLGLFEDEPLATSSASTLFDIHIS